MSTVKQLLERAKALGLSNYSGLNKEELSRKIDNRPDPPLYTPEKLPSYEAVKDDKSPNYYLEHEDLRKTIIDHFPKKYKKNEKQYHLDWDWIMYTQDTLTIIFDMEYLRRGKEDWKRKRQSMLAYRHLKSIKKISKTKIPNEYLSIIIQRMYDSLFKTGKPLFNVGFTNMMSDLREQYNTVEIRKNARLIYNERQKYIDSFITRKYIGKELMSNELELKANPNIQKKMNQWVWPELPF